MAALTTVSGASDADALPGATRHIDRDGQDDQLVALRSLLLGPLSRELEALRRRVDDIEDPQQPTCKLAERLPHALALRPATDKQMAAALSPLLKATLWEMRQRGHSAAGGTLRETFKLALHQVRSGVADIAQALLGRFAPNAQLARLRLIHRRRHALIEEYIGTFQEPEARDTGSMFDLLQDKLRDPEILHAYDIIEAFRVDNVTYAIHVGPLAILLSAIRGRRPQETLSRCKTSLEKIHQVHAVALGMFDPADPWTPILSGEASIFQPAESR